jgi:hypothetical protein
MSVAHRHGRFLSRRFLRCYPQEDRVNKAPSATCGNFATDTVCGYLWQCQRGLGPTEVRLQVVEEAEDTELGATGEYVNGLQMKAEPPVPEHLEVLCWTYEDQELFC